MDTKRFNVWVIRDYVVNISSLGCESQWSILMISKTFLFLYGFREETSHDTRKSCNFVITLGRKLQLDVKLVHVKYFATSEQKVEIKQTGVVAGYAVIERLGVYRRCEYLTQLTARWMCQWAIWAQDSHPWRSNHYASMSLSPAQNHWLAPSTTCNNTLD